MNKKPSNKFWIIPLSVAIVGIFLLLNDLKIRMQSQRSNRSGVTPVDRARLESEMNTDHGKMGFLAQYLNKFDIYGKVVDQHGNPIAGATIKATPADSPFRASTSAKETTSAPNGIFSFKGLRGMQVGLTASKKGMIDYELKGPITSSMVVTTSAYADPAHPLVLTLHDPGPIEPLVHLEDQRWKLPLDGTLTKISLCPGGKDPDMHAIEFRYFSERFSLPEEKLYGYQYNWWMVAKIPGGGFIRNENDLKMNAVYQFEAPETGYVEEIQYRFTDSQPEKEWEGFLKDSYFVKFKDGTYGRIRFSIEGFAAHSPLMMETWYNPKKGSRNLADLHH